MLLACVKMNRLLASHQEILHKVAMKAVLDAEPNTACSTSCQSVDRIRESIDTCLQHHDEYQSIFQIPVNERMLIACVLSTAGLFVQKFYAFFLMVGYYFNTEEFTECHCKETSNLFQTMLQWITCLYTALLHAQHEGNSSNIE